MDNLTRQFLIKSKANDNSVHTTKFQQSKVRDTVTYK